MGRLHLKQTVSTFPLFVPTHRTHKCRPGGLLFGFTGLAVSWWQGAAALLAAVLEAARWLLEADDVLLYRASTCLVVCLPVPDAGSWLWPALRRATTTSAFLTSGLKSMPSRALEGRACARRSLLVSKQAAPPPTGYMSRRCNKRQFGANG